MSREQFLLKSVRLRFDCQSVGPRRDLKAGEVGTVVEYYEAPRPDGSTVRAVDVEFVDEAGKTTALAMLSPDSVELVEP